MTATQKEIIHRLRQQGKGYAEISKVLGLPAATIKTYCYRNRLHTEVLTTKFGVCKNCGKAITEKSKTRPRVFCSDTCKCSWWNAHRRERNNDNIIEYTCEICGKHFFDYANANRKFCSLSCYRNRGDENAS